MEIIFQFFYKKLEKKKGKPYQCPFDVNLHICYKRNHMLYQIDRRLIKIEQKSKTTIDLNVINSKVDVDYVYILGF